MNRSAMKSILLLVAIGWVAITPSAHAAGPGRVIKVLPHLLDSEGRNSLSPSLYDRDAYQAFLRNHPEKQAGLRFDVHWKADRSRVHEPLLRIEVRSAKEYFTKPLVLEQKVKARSRLFGTWSAITIDGDTFKNMGEIFAWRVTLWSGNTLLAEQKSFLWSSGTD